jgi:hypothetical protein
MIPEVEVKLQAFCPSEFHGGVPYQSSGRYNRKIIEASRYFHDNIKLPDIYIY